MYQSLFKNLLKETHGNKNYPSLQIMYSYFRGVDCL